MANVALKNVIPPTKCYSDFLNELSRISGAFQTGTPPEERSGPRLDERCPPLTSVPFIFWSRDFLAAVAAPATSDSIWLTRYYANFRAEGGWTQRLLRWALACVRHSSGARSPTNQGILGPLPDLAALPADPADSGRKIMAKRIAKWAWRFEAMTIVAVAVTVMISIYALTGRLILVNEQATRQAWLELDKQLEAQEERVFDVAAAPGAPKAQPTVIELCDYVREVAAQPAREIDASPPWLMPAAAAASTEPTVKKLYISARQLHLCEQRESVLYDLSLVSTHLQSWSSVVTQRVGAGYMIHLWSLGDWQIPPLAALFGVMPSSLDEYAREANGDICTTLAKRIYDKSTQTPNCKDLLWTRLNRSRNIAESILGSISQYILPVCYGFLGAMAAALRILSRNARGHLVSNLDRARLVQGAILGILSAASSGCSRAISASPTRRRGSACRPSHFSPATM
ncbi:MAG: hypothetical protein J0H14_05815 [Alphaproteobacteria bacterium]|nr:hypothetical protein [Alphaproteobacteria bacterium]